MHPPCPEKLNEHYLMYPGISPRICIYPRIKWPPKLLSRLIISIHWVVGGRKDWGTQSNLGGQSQSTDGDLLFVIPLPTPVGLVMVFLFEMPWKENMFRGSWTARLPSAASRGPVPSVVNAFTNLSMANIFAVVSNILFWLPESRKEAKDSWSLVASFNIYNNSVVRPRLRTHLTPADRLSLSSFLITFSELQGHQSFLVPSQIFAA